MLLFHCREKGVLPPRGGCQSGFPFFFFVLFSSRRVDFSRVRLTETEWLRLRFHRWYGGFSNAATGEFMDELYFVSCFLDEKMKAKSLADEISLELRLAGFVNASPRGDGGTMSAEKPAISIGTSFWGCGRRTAE